MKEQFVDIHRGLEIRRTAREQWHRLSTEFFPDLLPNTLPEIRAIPALPTDFPLDHVTQRNIVVDNLYRGADGEKLRQHLEPFASPFDVNLHKYLKMKQKDPHEARKFAEAIFFKALHGESGTGVLAQANFSRKVDRGGTILLPYSVQESEAWKFLVQAHYVLGAEGEFILQHLFPQGIEGLRQDLFDNPDHIYHEAANNELKSGNILEVVTNFAQRTSKQSRQTTTLDYFMPKFFPDSEIDARENAAASIKRALEALGSTEIPREDRDDLSFQEVKQREVTRAIATDLDISYAVAAEIVYAVSGTQALFQSVLSTYQQDYEKAAQVLTIHDSLEGINAGISATIKASPGKIASVISRETLQVLVGEIGTTEWVQVENPELDDLSRFLAHEEGHCALSLLMQDTLFTMNPELEHIKADIQLGPIFVLEGEYLIEAICCLLGYADDVDKDSGYAVETEEKYKINQHVQAMTDLTPQQRKEYIRATIAPHILANYTAKAA